MGRLVQPARFESVSVRGGGGLESTGGAQSVQLGGDTYQDKIAKYIPGEVVAAYMALDRMLVDSTVFKEKAKVLSGQLESVRPSGAGVSFLKDPSTLLTIHNSLPLIILLVGLVFTPLYIRQLAINDGATSPKSWRAHALISTFAFIVWAYAIQGSAFTLGHLENSYTGVWASASLIVFTLASGLFGPPPLRSGDGAR
jgi:hypothetical protein